MPAAAAGVGAVQPGAVLAGEALLAHAGAVHAEPTARAVLGAAQLGAVVPGEALLAHALAVHAEPAGAAAGGAAELGAVLAPVVVVADALTLQAHAAAGAAPRAERLRAVAARPALHAHAAARLQAEIPVAAALRDVIQLPCKDAGPRVRTHRVRGGKRSVLVSGQPSEGLEKGGRCGTKDSPPSEHARTDGFRAERRRIGDTGSWWVWVDLSLESMASLTVGAISLVVVQVLPLVSLQLSTHLIGASLDLLLEKKSNLPWPNPLHQPGLLWSHVYPFLRFIDERSPSAFSLSYVK